MRKPLPRLRTGRWLHFCRLPHTHPASHLFGRWKAPNFSVPYAVRRLETAEAMQFALIEGAITWPQ